jgi:hypothetical protein
MEPMVIFVAGLVVYCGWLALLDMARGRARGVVKTVDRSTSALERGSLKRRRALCAAARPEGDAAGRWPAPVKGSV